MEEVYLAYFDFLGFKEFILRSNDDKILMGRMGHIFRDMEIALSHRTFLSPKNGIILSDLSKSKLNCLNISDTVLFWTKDCSIGSLKELIITSYEFNRLENLYNFPVRGAIIKGKVKVVSGNQINKEGSSHSVQCLYGQGLVSAYEKAEDQNWAGTIIENTVVQDLLHDTNNQIFLDNYAIPYKVPYKNYDLEPEYVLMLGKPKKLYKEVKDLKNRIDHVFKLDNKSINHPTIKEKIENTKLFIDSMSKHKSIIQD